MKPTDEKRFSGAEAAAATRLLAAAALGLLALALYLPALSHPFSLYDDPVYVTENPQVLAGVTRSGVIWAFTSPGEASNWHPVTWLSHMLDVTLFGARPGPHHLVNALLHALNAALFFWLLSGTTGSLWRSAAAASLFAAHPLRVESVAWIAERKDVLSLCFVLLTMLTYAGYARRPGIGRYVAVAVLAALALMSKPTAVTLPLLLLLFDIWPLGRWSRADRAARRTLLLEKVPLLVLSAAAAVVTVEVQRSAGSLDLLGAIPLGTRLANAAVSCAGYLRVLLWPSGLAVIYPYPLDGPGVARVLLAAIVLAGVTAFVARHARHEPWLVSGWGWYLVSLLPMSGIIQAGAQASADRYTYLPGLGLAWAVVWAIGARVQRYPRARRLAAAAGALAVALLAVLTVLQLRSWRSDVALFSRAVSVTRGNAVAHNNLALALEREGRLDDAIFHRREAIRFAGGHSEACKFHAGLGQALDAAGRDEEALAALREAVRLCPRHAQAQNDIAVLLIERGDLAGATAHLRSALEQLPQSAQLHAHLGLALEMQGRAADAAAEYRRALAIDPSEPVARSRLGAPVPRAVRP